jgi:hypothetical protein
MGSQHLSRRNSRTLQHIIVCCAETGRSSLQEFVKTGDPSEVPNLFRIDNNKRARRWGVQDRVTIENSRLSTTLEEFLGEFQRGVFQAARTNIYGYHSD